MPDHRADIEDLWLMRQVAREAGKLALQYQHKRQLDVWDKTKGHPVSEADLAVNDLLEETLRKARPHYGWLSEESAQDAETRSGVRVWVVDPIDGTRAFIKGAPYWCIGLSVIEQGFVRAGVIYAPQLDQLYEARLGGGAFLNNQPIHASDKREIENARLITNESVITHPSWPRPWPPVEVMKPKPNATLLRMCLVANGEWDAVLAFVRKSDWDLAPGAIIVSEAGGVAQTHLGEPYVFNRSEPAQRSLLAAGKPLHSLLSARVNRVKLPDPNWTVRSTDKTPDPESQSMTGTKETRQLLHIVIGGELKNVSDVEFEDLSQIDFVGAFPSYVEAYDAWKGAAQRTVDNAEVRYFILHAHKLLDPKTGEHHQI